MSDRELLALAAKAAGYEVEVDHKGVFHIHEGTGPQSWRPWNPLLDDGDALRLAVYMGLYDLRDLPYQEGNDPVWQGVPDYTAVRRAIVRAAAEIGRAMK